MKEDTDPELVLIELKALLLVYRKEMTQVRNLQRKAMSCGKYLPNEFRSINENLKRLQSEYHNIRLDIARLESNPKTQ